MHVFLSWSRRWAPLGVCITTITSLLVLLDAPTPPLFGGLCGAILVALWQESPPSLPPIVFRGAQAVIGATVATQIDLSAMKELGSDWPAVAGVTFSTIVLSVLIGQVLMIHGVSSVTAAFATIAGGVSSMSALARDYGADERVVIVVQYFRVLLILLTLPFAVTLLFEADVNTSPSTSAATGFPMLGWLYVLATLAGGLLLGRLARLPSPALFGCILAGCAVGQLPGFRDASVPMIGQAAGFGLIGVQAGIRFTPDTARTLLRMFPTVLIMAAVLVAGCGALGALLAKLTGESMLDSYLATSPGGLPVVLATVSETAGNVTFVSAAQMLRMIAVLLLAPIAATQFKRWRRKHDD